VELRKKEKPLVIGLLVEPKHRPVLDLDCIPAELWNRVSEVVADEFPLLGDRQRIMTPEEQFKRHGQAMAAASLPRLALRL
jgi:hypothetical protein